MLQTEHPFTLPKGLVDDDGTLHREGVMRLATAADEILPLQDPRVERNPAYLFVIILSRVVTKLGAIKRITPNTIERIYSEDLWYLQRLYHEINGAAARAVEAACPKCEHRFRVEIPLGEFEATP